MFFFRVISDQASWIVYFSHEANKKKTSCFFCTFAFAFYCHYIAWWVCKYEYLFALQLAFIYVIFSLILSFFSLCLFYLPLEHGSAYKQSLSLHSVFPLRSQHTPYAFYFIFCSLYACTAAVDCFIAAADDAAVAVVVLVFFTFRILSFSQFTASPVDLCTTHVSYLHISFLASFGSSFLLFSKSFSFLILFLCVCCLPSFIFSANSNRNGRIHNARSMCERYIALTVVLLEHFNRLFDK